MAFPSNPTEGQTHTENNTVWIYSAVMNQWNRSVINPLNETTYIGSDGAPGGVGSNTQVIFNDNGSLAGDAGLLYNKTTDALTTGSVKFTSLGTAAAPAISVTGDPNTGIYSPDADQLATSTAGVERLRIDSNGRLLVGTSSASVALGALAAKFQVQGTSVFDTGIINALWESSSNPAQLQLVKSRGASLGTHTVVQNNDTLGRVSFGGSDGTDFDTAAWIQCEVDGNPGANDMPGRLVFSTTADGASSPTERMRITNYGGTLLNTTSASINTTNFGTAVGCNSTAAAVPGLLRTARNGDGTSPVFESYGSAGQFRTLGDGDAENTNNSYAGISDIKLKENIVTAGSQWDDLKALQVRKYNFKAETGYNTHTQIGLIAQEVELISPGLVGESVDEETGESTKSVNYSVLYMKAVKALQEAMERIEQLEVKVAALEAQ